MCNRRNPLVALAVALVFVSLGLRAGAGATRAAQAQVITVGVVAFQDESGAAVAPALVGQLARTLQQRLAAAHKDLLPRAVGAEPGAPPPGTLGVEQLAALGKQRGLKYVVRGGVLALTPGGAGASVVAQVYAEVVSVEGGELRGVRAEGAGADSGAALNAAVEKLAGEVYKVIVSPSGEATNGAQSSPPSGESDIQSPAATGADESAPGESDREAAGAVEADEALRQLIAQSESLAASGTGSADSLGALSRALEGLKRALAAKAARLEQAQETAQADSDIASRRQELESVVARLTEEAAAETTDAGGGAAESVQASGEKKKLTASINDFLGESLSMLQKIQEMRALLRGAGEEQSSAGGEVGEVEGASAPVEEATEEVSGVVTEAGEPVEGLAVTDAESGQSATTGADGTYTLKGVPAGRLSNLVLTKAGAKVATARLDLLRGRSAVADFELKAGAGARAAASPLRVVPSTVFVKASKTGGTGTLKGVVRAADGRPLARALVTLHKLAVARTDSAGRYTFLNVPAGAQQLTIYRSGLRPKTERVRVAAKQSTESRVAFAPGDTTNAAQNRARLLDRAPEARSGGRANTNGGKPRATTPQALTPGARAGQATPAGGRPAERRAAPVGVIRPQPPPVASSTGQLSGLVVDAKTGRPVVGAAVSVAGLGRATTDRDGRFTFPQVAPGTHRINVRLKGYGDAAATAVVSGGKRATLNVRLLPAASPAPVRVR